MRISEFVLKCAMCLILVGLLAVQGVWASGDLRLTEPRSCATLYVVSTKSCL